MWSKTCSAGSEPNNHSEIETALLWAVSHTFPRHQKLQIHFRCVPELCESLWEPALVGGAAKALKVARHAVRAVRLLDDGGSAPGNHRTAGVLLLQQLNLQGATKAHWCKTTKAQRCRPTRQPYWTHKSATLFQKVVSNANVSKNAKEHPIQKVIVTITGTLKRALVNHNTSCYRLCYRLNLQNSSTFL